MRLEAREAEWANHARGSSRHSAKPARFAGISASAPSTIQPAPCPNTISHSSSKAVAIPIASSVKALGTLSAAAANIPGCSSFALRGNRAKERGSRVSSSPKANTGIRNHSSTVTAPRPRTICGNSSPSPAHSVVPRNRKTSMARPPRL